MYSACKSLQSASSLSPQDPLRTGTTPRMSKRLLRKMVQLDWSDAETDTYSSNNSNNVPMLCHSCVATTVIGEKILREIPSFSSFRPTYNCNVETVTISDTQESDSLFEPTPLAPPPLHHKPADAPGLCPLHSCSPCRPCNDTDDGPLVFPF
ncbi:hypothetical protein BD779DRAFT_1546287 [Infundibulicybe gibba]|nr:hypothetical protein BD779DRAFT_1546287 [Infundibulicybe gibba]